MKIEAWESPAGRLHLHRKCSGNGRPLDTHKVWVTEDEYLELQLDGKVCRCMNVSTKALK